MKAVKNRVMLKVKCLALEIVEIVWATWPDQQTEVREDCRSVLASDVPAVPGTSSRTPGDV